MFGVRGVGSCLLYFILFCWGLGLIGLLVGILLGMLVVVYFILLSNILGLGLEVQSNV